jgi:hypothetical protein
MQTVTRKILVLVGLSALIGPLVEAVAHSTPCRTKVDAVAIGLTGAPVGASLTRALPIDVPTRL